MAHPEKKLATLPPTRIEESVRAAAIEIAISNDRTLSWVVATALKEFIGRHEDKSDSMNDMFAQWKQRFNDSQVSQRATDALPLDD
ncbi:hypothetical protein [Propionivibrio sp.]|uniref:hypothetical protein n=1 Tax=Propionivibrio sp. TaxID=2212460 RepID=UPI003BEFFF80